MIKQIIDNKSSFHLFQVTVWDYVKFGANDFLGEIILSVSNQPLDDEPEWHTLLPHKETISHVVNFLKHCFLNFFIKLYSIAVTS